jgi:hypothetical protein
MCRCEIFVPREDVASGDQHAWCTVATLQCVLLRKCPAQFYHQRVVVQALDGLNFRTVTADGVRDAGAGYLAVDEHSAGTADSMFTAKMSAGQADSLA